MEQVGTRGLRDGIDKRFRVDNVILEFDLGKLRAIEFLYQYGFVNAPAPFAESWKKFVPIDSFRIRCGMNKADIIQYIKAWERRAECIGATRVEFGEMVRRQYSIDYECNQFWDMIQISMGPTRRTGGKGLWCDGWSIFFGMGSNSFPNLTEGVFASLTAVSDEFNSVAR